MTPPLNLVCLATILWATGVVALAQAFPPPPAGPGSAIPGQPGEPLDPLAPSPNLQPPLLPDQDPEAGYGRFPVKIVGGRLVAHCEISTIHRRIPANLFIDLENPVGLQLHNNAAQALEVENEAGNTIPVHVHFPEFKVQLDRREAGPEEVFNEFTRFYSREIDEDALVGALGAKFFKDYAVILDLQRGYVHIAPSFPDREGERDDVLEVSLGTTDDIMWLPVQLPGGKMAAMALATAESESLIDEVWCDALGHPAGNVSPLRLGDKHLSQRVAFRPAGINYVHDDGALGVIGLNLLRQLRVEIDQSRTRARIQGMVPPSYPQTDFAFYEALIDDDPDLYETYLNEHPQATHSQEAAQRLLYACIDTDAEPEAFERAITWLAGTWREDIVSTRALDLMKELAEAGYPEAALIAGELGVAGGRKDRYPEAVHHLHAAMGEILLESNDDRAAWRHLLSAAFGLPEDGMINLKLGEVYERQERYQRAMSRYIQAVIDADSGEQAVAGLERVSKLLGDDEKLSVDQIELLIAGKTYGYTAATRYRPEPEKESNRVVLLEFFTNAHLKHPSRDEGAIGGALGNEGLMTYFPREKVAMLAYHLPHPRLDLDSLTNEVAQAQADVYGVPPTIQLINGTREVPGAGNAREAEQIYRQARDIVETALTEPATVQLELEASITGDTLTGGLTVRGPEELHASVHIILAERGVLYPGRSKVIIHRMVARAALTRSVLGEPFQPAEDRAMQLNFKRSLREIEQGNRIYLDQLQAEERGMAQKFVTRMDPRQLTIVAFVRDPQTREILQAIQVQPKL